MDWGQFDQESAMRQRHLDIEDRIADIHSFIRRGRMASAEFREMYDISWLYHENGLEGVVLSYPEIKSAVDNKIISDISLLPTYKDIKNQKWCLDLMRDTARTEGGTLTVDMLCQMHARLVPQVRGPTIWRRDIPIHRTYFHEIAQPQAITAALDDVLAEINSGLDVDIHPLEAAASTHHRFMHVFPFSQGSGTIGRLLLNFILFRSDLFPVVVHASDRQRYYEALRGTPRDLHAFLAEAMENSLTNTLHFLRGQDRVAMRA